MHRRDVLGALGGVLCWTASRGALAQPVPPGMRPADPLYGDMQRDDQETDELNEPACEGGELSQQGDPPRLIFDVPPGDADLAAYRSTHDPLPALSAAQRRGLAALNASASAQFSPSGLAALQLLWRPQGHERVPVCDLRQEPHGMVGTRPMSWHAHNNWLNRDLGTAAAVADEAARLRQLHAQRGQSTVVYRLCKQQSGLTRLVTYVPVPWVLGPAEPEAVACARAGAPCLRLPMTDHTGSPRPEVVEAFLEAVRRRPADAWWHFHCRRGKGRATLFMAMLDIVRNARHTSLHDIVLRQELLGGVNVLGISRTDPQKSHDRRRFVLAFYERFRR